MKDSIWKEESINIACLDEIRNKIQDLLPRLQYQSGMHLNSDLSGVLYQLQDAQNRVSAMQEKAWKNLSHVLHEAPIGICVTDKNGIYQYVNPSYCRFYGYDEKELLGQHFTKVVRMEDKDMFVDLHDRFMGRKYELSGEWEVVDSRKQHKTIFANAAYLLDVEGEPHKVTFVVDITERKRMETELNETIQKLEAEIKYRKQLEETRDRVERIVKHDMKNPLNGVLGGIQLLMRTSLSDEQRSYLCLMKDSGYQMLHMLDNSFDYVRMENGTYETKYEEFYFEELIRLVKTEVSNYAEQHGVTISYFCNGEELNEEGQNCRMQGEKQHLAGMLDNLIRNAVEASDEGDRVTFTARYSKQDIHIDIHNPALVPVDVRRNFFDRYVTSDKKNGTGLGTYTAKLIAEYHNGQIDFTTAEGEGTHLLITLPLNLNY